MPKVPTLQRQIRPAALPDTRTNFVPSPQSFGAGLGETINNTIVPVVAKHLQQLQDDADTVALTEYDNSLADWEHQNLYDPQNGVLNTVKGKDAVGLSSDYSDKFDKFAGETAATMLLPRQQLAAMRLTSRRREGIVSALDRYGAREADQYANDTFDASIKNSVEAAAANATDPQRISTELQRQQMVIDGFAQRQGWSPEVRQQKSAEVRSATHVGVIDNLLALDKDQAAQVYFDEVKDQISGDKIAAIERALEAGTTQNTGLRNAQQLWAQFGPKSDEDPINADKLEEEARKLTGDNAKLYDATVKYLRERTAIVDGARKEREDATSGALWQAAAAGQSLAAVRKMPEFRAASGRVQAQISDYIVNRAEREASRAAAEESRAYTREQRAEATRDRNGLFMFYQYAKPENLGQMSDAQIWNLVPSIGERNVANLLELKSKFTADKEAPDDFRTFNEVVDNALEGAGVDPNPPKTDTENRAKVGWFKDRVAAEQRRIQALSKTKLSHGDIEAIANRILGQQVLDQGWLWNSTQNVMNATFGDIPSSALAALRQSFAKQGVANPTNEQLLRAWLDWSTSTTPKTK